MAGRAVPVTPVKKVGSLFDELTEIERQLSERAFELFEGNDPAAEIRSLKAQDAGF